MNSLKKRKKKGKKKKPILCDTLYLKCPGCESFIPITTYNGLNAGIDFCLDEAPLKIIAEVHEESKNGKVKCPSCGMDIALVVRFVAYEQPLSEQKQYCKKWRKG